MWKALGSSVLTTLKSGEAVGGDWVFRWWCMRLWCIYVQKMQNHHFLQSMQVYLALTARAFNAAEHATSTLHVMAIL